MILVTGGTGFIGRVLIRQLTSQGYAVRILIRPSKKSPILPRGVPVEVAVCSLKDERGLRAAMKGVDIIYHLAGVEGRGNRADLMAVDIQGTQTVVNAAVDAGVKRFFYLSHLGADRASAYPILKVKAIAESYIRQSGLPYTILRPAIVFGPYDHFTNGLGVLMNAFPGIFLVPGDGETLLQPIWVEDLVTCLVWSLDNPNTINQVLSLGGPDYLSFKQILEIIMPIMGIKRWLVPISPVYLRSLTVLFEHTFSGFPVSVFWIDYLAADRTCSLDTIPRFFGLMPARFEQRLDFLRGRTWKINYIQAMLNRVKYRTNERS
jgi:nucleoside-diphosphate-sugar epimerase